MIINESSVPEKFSGKDCITTADQKGEIVTKYNVILSLREL